MDSRFVMRPFMPADQVAARRLIQEGLGEHFGFIDETMNPDIDDINASYIAPGHEFYVVVNGPKLVATCALMLSEDGVGQMVRVSVAKQYRRHGIARAIVARLSEIARQRGMRRLQVETNNDWVDAIWLYHNSGFSQYDCDDVSVYMAVDFADQPSALTCDQGVTKCDQPFPER
jgi:N-acetylglutamate synthase-like GNAT family acetyltransferase